MKALPNCGLGAHQVVRPHLRQSRLCRRARRIIQSGVTPGRLNEIALSSRDLAINPFAPTKDLISLKTAFTVANAVLFDRVRLGHLAGRRR
jgi:hypothetical protein